MVVVKFYVSPKLKENPDIYEIYEYLQGELIYYINNFELIEDRNIIENLDEIEEVLNNKQDFDLFQFDKWVITIKGGNTEDIEKQMEKLITDLEKKQDENFPLFIGISQINDKSQLPIFLKRFAKKVETLESGEIPVKWYEIFKF